jgi:hypothetical protein
MLRMTFLLFAVLPISGQVPRPSEFEVASVKPVAPTMESRQTVLSLHAGHFDAEFAALRQLAGVAYGIQRGFA